MNTPRAPDVVILPASERGGRLLAGALCSVLVHIALFLGWQAARMVPAAPSAPPASMLWVRVAPAQAMTPPAPVVRALPLAKPVARPRQWAAPASAAPAPAPEPVPPEAISPVPASAAQSAPTAVPAPLPDAAAILDQARRSAGDIERALRKERQPTIVAPPDSPEIRMRREMEVARSLAPPRLWEAPKTVELVNNTGDGARRTRVITGNGTYCITERSPVTAVDMIEKHGRQRFTNCPQHEEPATPQEWRTARD